MQSLNFQYRLALALVVWAFGNVGLQAVAETQTSEAVAPTIQATALGSISERRSPPVTPALIATKEAPFASVADIESGFSDRAIEAVPQKFLSVELDNTKVAADLPSTQLNLDPGDKITVERVTPVAELENFAPPSDRWVGRPDLTGIFAVNSRAIAQAQEKAETNPESSTSETPKEPASPPPVPPDITLDSVATDFSYQSDNFNLVISSLEPSIVFRLANGNKFSIKSGFVHLRDQPGFKAVTIYPVRVGWEGNIERAIVKAGVTYNSFDRLPSSFGFDAGVTIPVSSNLIVGASFERTPMKYAPSTLEIPGTTTYNAYGPNLLWFIDRDTSLFSFISFIDINDGNSGSISFTKLKRNFGQFSIAANVVTTSYAKDSAPNIFTPQDFMIYNGEIGWQGDITDFLNLRAQFNLGEQRLRGEWTNAYYYEIQLTAKLSSTVDAFINYSFGKLNQISYFRAFGANDLYSRTLIAGQLRVRF
jgi:hypothetical protein